MKRISQINRKTNETNTILDIDLDGEGISNIQTNIGFFNHMIDLLAFHSNININLNADGDIDVCDHHLIEDVGIALGKCMNEALGERRGIKRRNPECQVQGNSEDLPRTAIQCFAEWLRIFLRTVRLKLPFTEQKKCAV